MLDRIIEFSLKNRLSVAIASLLLVISGIYVTATIDIDIFPELTAPTVVVMTEAHGMAPEEVEMLVSFPIETSMNGATNVRRVRSESSMGFSVVWVEFDWDSDIYSARQTVTERLVQINDLLPPTVSRPVIAPQSSLLGEMMIIAMQSDSVSPMELRRIGEWNVAPRLLSVPGVAQVTTIGGDAREYQIKADPYRMNHYGVTLADLEESARDINRNSSGRFISQHGNTYLIRGIARTKSTDEIAASVIKMQGGLPVTIADVADVVEGPALAIGTASYRGRDAVLVTITKQPDINTIRLSENIRSAIDEMNETFGDRVSFHTDVYNQDDFIHTAINNVARAVIEGGIFVIIILFIFLMNYRTTTISLTAIPLSLLTTVIVLRLMGYTINTMSLGGMAIAIGAIVDDAIIDVDNVYKRLRQNIQLPKEKRKPLLRVVFDASSEIRTTIFNTTVIIIITFTPLFLLEGMEGRMLKPLGISFIVALLSSTIVALSVTPVYCSYMLTNEKSLIKNLKGSWVERRLGSGYRKILSATLTKYRLVGGITGALLIAAVVMMFTFGSAFLPPFNEGALTVNLSAMPGISLEESSRAGREAELILMDIPEIESVSRKTGRAELAEHSFGENVSEIDAPFTLNDRSRDEFMADVRDRLSHLHGLNIEVGQPITHRMDHMLSGTRTNIAIKVFGDDINTLYSLGNQIEHSIGNIAGIGDLNVEPLIESPHLKIKANREMLARYGIPVNRFTSFV